MVVFNYSGREINAKIVYYGPGLSGKTTNLEFIYSKTAPHLRGKMVSMKTKVDRTLFFDLLPIEGGEIAGFNVRFLLYTVPGQVYYNATRKLVLKGADAIVFVADSQAEELAANRESLKNLRENLQEHGKSLEEIPIVMQYNKRDLPSALPVEKLEEELNPMGAPSFESVATTGMGVFETLAAATKMVIAELRKQLSQETETDAGGQELTFGLTAGSERAPLSVGQAENDSSTIKDKVPDVPSPGEEPPPVPTAEGPCPPDKISQTAFKDESISTLTEAIANVEPRETSVADNASEEAHDSCTSESGTPDLAHSDEPTDVTLGSHPHFKDGKLTIPIRVSSGGKPGHVVVNLAVDVEIVVDEEDQTI